MIFVPCTCHLSSFSLETRPHSIRFSSISLSFSLHFNPDPAAGITKLCLACASSAHCMLLSHWNPDHNRFIFLPFLFLFFAFHSRSSRKHHFTQPHLRQQCSTLALVYHRPTRNVLTALLCVDTNIYIYAVCAQKNLCTGSATAGKKQEKLELGKHPKTP
jgi:hypothetical protein